MPEITGQDYPSQSGIYATSSPADTGLNPWEMNWKSSSAAIPTYSPISEPVSTVGKVKPWERDWSNYQAESAIVPIAKKPPENEFIEGTVGTTIVMCLICYFIYRVGSKKIHITLPLQAFISGVIAISISINSDTRIGFWATWSGWLISLLIMAAYLGREYRKTNEQPVPDTPIIPFKKEVKPESPIITRELQESIGVAIGFITFFVSWIYCMANYGFLFGFGFGWIPSAILAALIASTWHFILIIIVYAVIVIGGYILLH